MKPLVLKLTAFGPYKNTEQINFQELKEQNLFVVSGNTGSGKTTIFDGICFALYGSASGQDRSNQTMLRSDFAADDTHTAVELTFLLKNKTYRILRQLGHVKQGNKSKTGDQYEFYEQVDGREIPAVDRQIVSEINEKIETLIGLTQDQFKQIVMLPQGEFRKLLTSETENKEQILRRLFKTHSYQQINDELRVRKQQTEKIYNDIEQRLHNDIHQLRGSLPEREGVVLHDIMDTSHVNVHQLLTALKSEINHYENQVKIDKNQYEMSYNAHHKKQSQFHVAQTVNDRFVEHDQKNEILKSLKNKEQHYKNKEDNLEKANRAHHLLPYERQMNESNTDKEQKVTQLKKAELALQQNQKHLEECKTHYEQGERDKSLREDTKQKLDRLQEYLPTVKEINNSKQALAVEEKQVKKLKDNIKIEKQKLEALKTKTKASYEQAQELDTQINDLPEVKEKLLQMREQTVLLKNYLSLSEQLNTLKASYKTKHEKFKQLKSNYEYKEEQWINNQASLLAHHLHKGDSCPVCGSKEHPKLATADEQLISREELQLLKKQLDSQDEICRNLKAEGQSTRKHIEDATEEIETQNLVNEISEVTVSKTIEKVIVDGKICRQKVDTLEEKRKKLSEIRKEYEKTKKDMEELEETVHKLETKYNEQQTTYEKNRATFKERIRVIPENVRDYSTLRKQINELDIQYKKLEAAWKKATEQYQLAREKLATAKTTVINAEKQLNEATNNHKDFKKQFEQVLKDASFRDISDYENAKMSERERTELNSDIEKYNQKVLTTKAQIDELMNLLKGKKQVDLTHLTTELSELKKTYEEAFNAWNQSKNYLVIAQKAKNNIKKSQEQLKKVEHQLSLITDLYDVTRGQNSRKISFERYLQIEYLERIIHAANERLKVLSNGQFLLMRSDRQESHGRQSGLALDVYDGYTGQTRDVKTLSGGEKFNASLCLALGMSDVIQSFEGNISIQTMFIDEGFGSLDEESLNKAVETLIDLQASGRMIGVISHVQELKTIFPAVLEVKKTSEGHSHTQFKVN